MESYAADLPAVQHNSTDSLTQPLSTNGAHHHPPYSEMIIGAISGLKDKDGSSKQAIAKYIDQVYGASNLPPTHASLLTHHLKRMKNDGQLIMVKHSYMLPTATSTTIETRSVPFETQSTTNLQDYTVPNTFAAGKPQVRRKPGRPAKAKHDFGLQLPLPTPVTEPYQPQFEQQHHKQDFQSQTQTQTQTHLGQDYGAEPISASLGLTDDGVPPPPPPPPHSADVVKRSRGRPPKNANKPGRPKLNSNTMVNGGGSKRGRRKRISGLDTASSSTMTLRERPPKSATPSQHNGGGGGGDAEGRRRGRGRAPGNKFRSQSFNRPSQDESGTDIIVTDPEQLVAYQELKLKYEHLQSKTKQTVDVVRRYINPDYEAFSALQELEMLVGTDMNVQTEKPPSYV